MSSVSGGFETQGAVRMAVDRLLDHGFSAADIRYATDENFTSDAPTALGQPDMLAKLGRFFATLGGTASDSLPAVHARLIARGGSVLVVEAATEVESKTARRVMQLAGAIELDAPAAARPSDGALAVPSKDAPARVEDDREVNVGGLPLTRLESAASPSRPVKRAAASDLAVFTPGSFEIRQRVEQRVITKSARVIEEVVIRKSVTAPEEAVSAVLRTGTVDLEPYVTGPATGAAGRPAD